MSEPETISSLEEGKATLRERFILWLARGDVVVLNCTMHCPLGWELHGNKLEPHAFIANSTFRSYDPEETTLESIGHTRVMRSVPKR